MLSSSIGSSSHNWLQHARQKRRQPQCSPSSALSETLGNVLLSSTLVARASTSSLEIEQVNAER